MNQKQFDAVVQLLRNPSSFNPKANTQARLMAADELVKLRETLKKVDTMVKYSLPKFNWGGSCLDALSIKLLNEVPSEVAKALAEDL